MRVALVGRPGSGKTTLFNALAEKPVDLVPGVPGGAPHVSVVRVRDERHGWLCDHYEPQKRTPATLVVEDHPGIPPGSAKIDRRGELFGRMRNADGLVVVAGAFGDKDAASELELVSLEFLTADLEICERRLERLAQEWKKPAVRDRVERERATVERLVAALTDGAGAHTVEVKREEEIRIKGFQLLTKKPVVVIANLVEGGAAEELAAGALHVKHRFDACLRLEADLAAMDGEERDLFAASYGIAEPFSDRFTLACYRGLGLRSFFTVIKDEVKAWTILAGDDAVTAAGKIRTDLARGFIRAEVMRYEDLFALGSEREVKAKGKQRLEGKDYLVDDGDIVNVRFSA